MEEKGGLTRTPILPFKSESVSITWIALLKKDIRKSNRDKSPGALALGITASINDVLELRHLGCNATHLPE